MTVKISIIGLGQIGTSIGLALADRKELLVRTGFDREARTAQQALKIGALDKTESDIHRAVRSADLIVLALPVDKLREIIQNIAIDLKEDAVLVDTSPLKEIVANWAAEYLPENRHYVGITPVISPLYLHGQEAGIEAARGDLFRGGIIAIAAGPRVQAQALKLTADLTRLLGATPLFFDAAEIDGIMASTHLLPQLTAAALINATVDQPGWREARKVAGRAFAEATAPAVILDDAQTLATAALITRENTLRLLDNAIAALQAIRDDVKNQDDKSLVSRLSRARQNRDIWWHERQAADWASESLPAVDLPESPGIMGRILGIGSKKKKSK